MSPYAGQNCYLAIIFLVDTYGMLVDDVKVGQEPSTPTEESGWGAIKGLFR